MNPSLVQGLAVLLSNIMDCFQDLLDSPLLGDERVFILDIIRRYHGTFQSTHGSIFLGSGGDQDADPLILGLLSGRGNDSMFACMKDIVG